MAAGCAVAHLPGGWNTVDGETTAPCVGLDPAYL